MVILVCWNQFNEMALIFTFSISFSTGFRETGFDFLFPLWTRRPVMSKLSEISDRKQDQQIQNLGFLRKVGKTRKEQ